VRYPSLMNKHQMMQGYTPSLESMFNGSMRAPPVPQSLLFVPEPTAPPPKGSSLYPPGMLPPASEPVPMPMPTQQQQQQQPQPYPYWDYASPKAPSPQPPGAPPRGPRSAPPHTPASTPASTPAPDRIIKSLSKTDPVSHDLKTVNLPRDCLSRFLSIAALNTTQNRETCGLLLGKDKGHKFVVTTLLIPKQHSTSDTCTMDKEELVMQFTEERSLITLGWVSVFSAVSDVRPILIA
jgi:STAM-binding protein